MFDKTKDVREFKPISPANRKKLEILYSWKEIGRASCKERVPLLEVSVCSSDLFIKLLCLTKQKMFVNLNQLVQLIVKN